MRPWSRIGLGRQEWQEQININCDMGEGFGRWTLGDDAGILRWCRPRTSRPDSTAATRRSCAVSSGWPKRSAPTLAPVALPDLLGFGRRRIDVSPQELQDYVTYQIGALGAFARAAGAELTHVKPHGILYSMAGQDPAIGRAC